MKPVAVTLTTKIPLVDPVLTSRFTVRSRLLPVRIPEGEG